MILKWIWYLALVAPIDGIVPNIIDLHYNITSSEVNDNGSLVVKREIDSFFHDTRNLGDLCKKFITDFGVNVCEMERGWKKRNRNGYYEVDLHEFSSAQHNITENYTKPTSGDRFLMESRWTNYLNRYGGSFMANAIVQTKKAAVSGLSSIYNSTNQDRSFKLKYTVPTGGVARSSTKFLLWTGENHGWFKRCTSDEFISGVVSYYSKSHKSRIFRIGCASFQGVTRKKCQWTSWMNELNETLTYDCGSDEAMAGIKSKDVSREEDRSLAFFCCEMVRSRKPKVCPVTEWSKKNDLKGKAFKRSVRLLVADPEFSGEDFQRAREALHNFNYCTENLLNFEFDTYIIPADVSSMNWKDATYQVMQQAKDRGVDFNVKEKMRKTENVNANFNTDKYSNMIILPDHVDFEGFYGFGILHNGLSVIKASEAKSAKSIIHELGHNLGMRHSTYDGDEYGDDRCIMGDPRNFQTCFNGAKSAFMGLYRGYSVSVNTTFDDCNIVMTLADVSDHLYKSRFIREHHGAYYVVIGIPLGEKGAISQTTPVELYLMYYLDEDIVVATKAGLGEIKAEGRSILFADTSDRVFDLKMNDTKFYDNGGTGVGVFIKRCPASVGIARVLISSDPNAENEC